MKKIVISLMVVCVGCTEEMRTAQEYGQKVIGRLKESDLVLTRGTSLEDLEKLTEEQIKVSRLELDTAEFQVTKLAVGLKDFVDSKSPFVTFSPPPRSDYIELIRCENNVHLSGGTTPISLRPEFLAGKTEEELSDYYSAANIWRAATVHPKCVHVSLGEVGIEFVDSFTPSGSFIWLARACISPGRLLEKTLGSDSCSNRVAVSPPRLDYVNNRDRKEDETRRSVAEYSSKMDMNAVAIRSLALDYHREINLCEQREHKRMVDLEYKKAVVQLAGTILEVGLEVKTWTWATKANGARVSGIRQVATHPGDAFGLLMALGGWAFAPMLINLFSSEYDFPRSCAVAEQIDNNLKTTIEELSTNAISHGVYVHQLQLRQEASSVTAGDSSAPAVNDDVEEAEVTTDDR